MHLLAMNNTHKPTEN